LGEINVAVDPKRDQRNIGYKVSEASVAIIVSDRRRHLLPTTKETTLLTLPPTTKVKPPAPTDVPGSARIVVFCAGEFDVEVIDVRNSGHVVGDLGIARLVMILELSL
jgi:hypothetical protein